MPGKKILDLPTAAAFTGAELLEFSQGGTSVKGLLSSLASYVSVGGTTARIDVSGGRVDISSLYVGQTSITTVGTLTTGTIGAGFTTISAVRGGTGFASYTKGDILAASGSSNLAKLGVGSDGQILSADSGQSTGLKWISVPASPLTATFVGYGSASNLVTGSSRFTWTNASGTLVISDGTLSTTFNSTARLTLAAGSATASTAPMKCTSGALLTVAEAGCVEYNNSHFITKNSGLRLALGGVMFENFTDAGNSTTVKTDLYSYTTPASTLAADGDKIEFEYGGVFVSSATATREITIAFAGTDIFDTGALTLSLSSAWTIYGTIVRVSASVIRYMISLTTQGAALSAYTSCGELTGLTLSGANVLKTTGQAAGVGAATNDIVAKLARALWFPKANN